MISQYEKSYWYMIYINIYDTICLERDLEGSAVVFGVNRIWAWFSLLSFVLHFWCLCNKHVLLCNNEKQQAKSLIIEKRKEQHPGLRKTLKGESKSSEEHGNKSQPHWSCPLPEIKPRSSHLQIYKDISSTRPHLPSLLKSKHIYHTCGPHQEWQDLLSLPWDRAGEGRKVPGTGDTLPRPGSICQKGTPVHKWNNCDMHLATSEKQEWMSRGASHLK